MKKTRGFYLINIVLSLSVFLIFLNLGGIYLTRQQENKELREAKIKICEVLSTYRTKALNENCKYYIKFNYVKKIISISPFFGRLDSNPSKVIKLPSNLKYTTIFDKETQKKFIVEITPKGNVVRSFSIYIFDYRELVRYRISIYGFELIRYFKINVYENTKRQKIYYNEISRFHSYLIKNRHNWREE